ncbi:MAG TPA: glycosyltransferase [Opitutaceae bacterium]|jgi:glycosyltransferase involved in cell wall biosynthesis
MKVSVVICTHNPVFSYLERALGALRLQTLPVQSWSLLVVDNGSSTEVSRCIDLSWHPHGRIVREDTLGCTFARLRGIKETDGEIIVFVDDDNLLDADYLEKAVAISQRWPQLGAWGGSIVPIFEEEPADRLRPYLRLLALREVTEPRWSNVWHCKDAEPWGAGLCLRRQAAEGYAEYRRRPQLLINDRSGKLLLSGGDTEISYVACSLGMGMGLFPDLRLSHIIPKRRLQEDYIVKIAQGSMTSSLVLFYKWGGTVPENPFSIRSIARLVKHSVLLRGIERRLSFASFRAARAASTIISSYSRKAA